MPNTYTQLYVQIVFAVKGRQNLIPPEHTEELHRYMTAVVQNRGAKMLAIHCMPDHVHIFIGFSPTLTGLETWERECKLLTGRPYRATRQNAQQTTNSNEPI